MAGNIDAQELPSTIHLGRIEPYMVLRLQMLCNFGRGCGEIRRVDAGQIGGFEVHDLYAVGKGFVNGLAQELIVAVQILFQAIQPGFALIICSAKRDGPKGIDIAHFVIVDGPFNGPSVVFSLGDDVGNLQASQIEALGGGIANDGRFAKGLRQRMVWREMMAGHGQFTMYFIAHHYDTVLAANSAQLLQFITAPYASRRIVGIAEQQQFVARIGGFLLQVLIVNVPLSVLVDLRVRHQRAPIVANARKETVVGWGLQNYAITGMGEGLYDG